MPLLLNGFARLFPVSAAMLSALACIEFAHAAAIHQTPSIGASFAVFWKAARDRPFQQQEILWDKVIEKPRQNVYASVVWEIRDHLHWKEEKERLLSKRFLEYPALSGQIAAAARTLGMEIPVEAAHFRGLFPDASARPAIRLVLAPNFDAKSGVLGNETLSSSWQSIRCCARNGVVVALSGTGRDARGSVRHGARGPRGNCCAMSGPGIGEKL